MCVLISLDFDIARLRNIVHTSMPNLISSQMFSFGFSGPGATSTPRGMERRGEGRGMRGRDARGRGAQSGRGAQGGRGAQSARGGAQGARGGAQGARGAGRGAARGGRGGKFTPAAKPQADRKPGGLAKVSPKRYVSLG